MTKATDPPGQVALLKRSKEVFVGHPKVSADFNPKLQSSSGCFQGVSLSEGINNALFQVPSSSQFQFPDVLEAEFRLDPEFRQRVVGLERMLRVRDSLQAKSACAAENDAHDSVSECGSCEIALKNKRPEVTSGRGCRSLRDVCRQFDRGGLLEPDLTKKHSSNLTAEKVVGHELLHATADELSGVICLLEAPDGDVRTCRATTAGATAGTIGLLEVHEPEFSEVARTASAAATTGESVGIIGLRQVMESDVARPSLIHESSLAHVHARMLMRLVLVFLCLGLLHLVLPLCLLIVLSRMLVLLRMHVERWRVLVIRVVWTR